MHAKHYERVIAVCCFMFLFIDIGLPSTSFSVYQPYIVSLPGIGDEGGSAVIAVRTLTSTVAMFFVNIYLNRFDVRAGVTIACLLTAAGFVIYGIATSLPVFLVGAVFSGLGYGLGGMVGMTILVGRWFKSRVGTAVGIASVGSGVASIIMPIVALQLIHTLSLSAAFFFEAVVAVLGAVVVVALLRNHPSDIGAHAYGGAAADGDVGAGTDGEGALDSPASPDQGADADAGAGAGGEVQPPLPLIPRHMRALLLAAMVVVGAFCMGGMSYLSVHLTTLGYDPVFSGVMVSVAGLSLTVSKFASGELIDHIGPRKGSALLFALILAGSLLYALAGIHSYALVVIGAICYAAGASIGTVGISLWSLELSDPSTKARTVKNFQICYALGGFIFNTFPGAMKAMLGTYTPYYVVLLVLGFFMAGIVLHAYRKYRPEMG